MSNQRFINRAALAADVEAGMKKEELAKKYTDGNKSAIAQLLKSAGLRIKQTRVNAVRFVLSDGPEESANTSVEAEQDAEFNAFEHLAQKQEENNTMSH